MTYESEKSDAFTSDTDEDMEMEQHEYDRKRELYLSKIIFCERKFQEIKPALLRLRLNQIEAFQDSLLNHKSDYYLSRKAVLDNEFDAKRNHIKILRQLRLEALHRRIIGDRFNVDISLANSKAIIKEEIRESLHLKYERLQAEQRQIKSFAEFASGFSNDDFMPTMTSGVDKPTSSVIDNYISKKDDVGRPLWTNIPVLIAQLPMQKIDEDLQMLNSMESITQ